MPRSAGRRPSSRCGRSSMKLVVTRPARKSGSSSTAARNGRFVATPRMRNSATARRARRTAFAKVWLLQVSLTSMESKCGLTSAATCVPPSSRTPGAARRAVGADHARVRPEAVGRVLGGDPALQRGAVDMDLLLLQVHLGQRHAGRDPELGDHQVAAGDLLGDGVLDLDARVHLDEHVLPALVEQELHRAGVDVADVAGERDGVGADAVADTRVQVLGRGDLDHLLVAPLQGAVALVEVHDSARGVGEDLHLDVPRVDHGALQEHRRVAERGLRLAHGGRDGLAQLPRLVDAAHPAPAAARHRLDEQREAQLVRRRDELLDLRGRRRRPEHRQARLPGGGDGAGLVAGQVQHLRRRPDERDAGVRTGLRQVRVLGQESVSGVDRVRARPPGSGDHLVDRQVGPHGVAALADHVRLVGLRAVQRVAVLVREHRDGRQFELIGRTEGADRDLTTVGDEQLAEHGTPRVRPSAR